MICIIWAGFPQYGARCVGAFVQSTTEKVVVVAMRPDVPIKGMERLAGCPVVWVEADESRSIAEICGEMPRFISVSGWYSPLYNRWRDEVRAAGGIACCGCDNNYVLNHLRHGTDGVLGAIRVWLKEVLRMVRFRLFFKNKYDVFWVPGKSGRKLFRFYGVPDEKIFEASYSADGSLFRSTSKLSARPKKMIYVGRLNERKNVMRLVQAFAQAVAAKTENHAWQLEMYGCGPLKDELLHYVESHSLKVNIQVYDFLQPEELALKYQQARLFCLPSVSEHWGLVVHEAALSGCVLLLSDGIGAGEDMLAAGKNGFTFNPYSVDEMTQQFQRAMSLEDNTFDAMQSESLRLAQTISLEKFTASVKAMSELKV